MSSVLDVNIVLSRLGLWFYFIYVDLYIYIYGISAVDNRLGWLGYNLIIIYVYLTSEIVYINLKHASANKWNMLVKFIKSKRTDR